MGSKYTFENKTSQDKFKELLLQYDEFRKDSTNSTKATELSVNAWHLIDWIFEEFRAIHLTNSIGDFRTTLYPQCESLKIMHDIANGAKHSEVTRPKATIKSTGRPEGAFESAFAREFEQTYLEIVMEDGTKLWFVDEIAKVIKFWKEYFRDRLNIIV